MTEQADEFMEALHNIRKGDKRFKIDDDTHTDGTYEIGGVSFGNAVATVAIHKYSGEVKLGWGEFEGDHNYPLATHQFSLHANGRYYGNASSYSPEELAEFLYQRLKKITQPSSYVVQIINNRRFDDNGLKIKVDNSDSMHPWLLVECTKLRSHQLADDGYDCRLAKKGIYVSEDGSEKIVTWDGAPVYVQKDFPPMHATPADARRSNPNAKYLNRAPGGGFIAFTYGSECHCPIAGEKVYWFDGDYKAMESVDIDDEAKLAEWSDKKEKSLKEFPRFDGEHVP